MVVYRFLRKYWAYVSAVLGPYTLIKGFGFTLAQTADFLHQYLLHVNVLWLVASGLIFYLTLNSWRHRGVPLTAIRTDIEVTYEDPQGHHVRVTRRQLLRANRDDVTGYIRHLWSEGTIPREDIECTIDHANGEVMFDKTLGGHFKTDNLWTVKTDNYPAETGGVLLRRVLGAQVGLHFGTPASRAALEDVRVM